MPRSIFSHFTIALFIVSNFAGSSLAHDGHHTRPSVNVSALSQLRLGNFDQGAAEIVAYDVKSQRAYITNAETTSIDVISIAQPSSPTKIFSIDLTPHGNVNSVAVFKDTIAVALAAPVKQDNGNVALFDDTGKHLASVVVGALPDMVTFTPDGTKILVANEGEPSDDYQNDPEGSISIISLPKNIQTLQQSDVQTADFSAFNNKTLPSSVRIFGKNASVAQDIEPEYITVSTDSKTAWVSLQENNALAVIDIENNAVNNIIGLGFKSYNNEKNAIDASDKDNKINIKAWPVLGMYQPDSIANYRINGKDFIVTANEGDARDYGGFSEEKRLGNAALSRQLLDSNPDIINKKNLGRLKITTENGDIDGDGKIDQLYSYGARSFSIWNADGTQVYDSGSDFATVVAKRYPKLFNKNDSRSDDKGSEPEALTIGKIANQYYAFIGLERTGGVMVYNINNPSAPYYADYINTISPELPDDDPKQGDIAPESLVFVSAKNSPNGKPLLLSANEVSGTFSIYLIEKTRK